MRLLVAEDDPRLLKTLTHIFESNKFSVDGVSNGEDALAHGQTVEYDGMVLDIMMPGMDGISVLKALREAGVTTPALFLTARSEVSQRVEGLDAGADDYLAKPFAAEELLARVRALGRRPAEWEGGTALRRGDVELRVQDRLLTGPAGAHTLSQRECALLELFLRNPGVTLPRERILLNVWGPDSDVESGNIDNYIHLVRRRLRLVGSRMELVTRRGAGYRLEADPC